MGLSDKGAYPDNGQDNQGVFKYSKHSCMDSWHQATDHKTGKVKNQDFFGAIN